MGELLDELGPLREVMEQDAAVSGNVRTQFEVIEPVAERRVSNCDCCRVKASLRVV